MSAEGFSGQKTLKLCESEFIETGEIHREPRARVTNRLNLTAPGFPPRTTPKPDSNIICLPLAAGWIFEGVHAVDDSHPFTSRSGRATR
jgi:hypothetical protein